MQVTVYIDGFNLYYGALKPTPSLKWLDLQTLADALRPGDVCAVRYFTARVLGVPDATPQNRQKLYLAALSTLPRVSVHFGRFKANPSFLPLVTPVAGKPSIVEVLRTVEKGSDVNLATLLLLDGIDGLYDEAVVISGDSDLAEPIAAANARFGPVHVLNPRPLNSRELSRAAASFGQLPLGLLRRCQFADTVMLRSGRAIRRPPSWT